MKEQRYTIFQTYLETRYCRGIGSTEDRVQKRTYQLTGIRRIIARTLGATQQSLDFYNHHITIARLKIDEILY
jgi:hypothetical protein